ncbi:DMT family transporter [Vagococcus fessus]|uniref:EamA domain-containing protein n=1 Tax=Vagococcus fessus TaxID=120370 RepID=A0A430AD44_9ENTE|nr:DMT family transporter [Vagococcus fessus]RSU05122.1 hypothetical protein CBF31_03655 [Vagococcus fessus]
MNKHLLGKGGLVLVTIIWGSSFALNDVALRSFTPVQLLTLRFGIAGVLMLVLFWKQLTKVAKEEMIRGIILGVILFIAYILQTVALLYTTPSKNAFLTSFSVVLVPIISYIFLKTKVHRKDILGALLSLSGVALMSLTDLTMVNIGDILTLTCAIFFALYIIYTTKYVKVGNPYALTTIQLLTAFVLSGMTGIVLKENWNFDSTIANSSVLYLAIFCTMIAYLLQTMSQRYTTSSETAVILSMEALFGMIFSMIIVNEHITDKTAIGAGLIFLGVIVVEVVPTKLTKKIKT